MLFSITIKKFAICKAGVSNPRAACGPQGPFVRPAMLFGDFQMINISLPSVLKKDSAK